MWERRSHLRLMRRLHLSNNDPQSSDYFPAPRIWWICIQTRPIHCRIVGGGSRSSLRCQGHEPDSHTRPADPRPAASIEELTLAIIKPTITIDGNFSDWDSSELITTPANVVASYSLFGTVQNDTYYIGIQATSATDPVIGAGTTIWLNTDQNTATGFSPFGNIGAEYSISYFTGDAFNPAGFYLYTGNGVFLSGPLTTAPY